MKIHALVPVKSLHDAKSRLAKDFTQNERSELVLSMLDHVLVTLKACKEITNISLVTPDKNIAEHAKKFDAKIVSEEKSGYNQSLMYAARRENKNEKLLTLPADLPFLTTNDIHKLCILSQQYDLVLAPSKDKGTNAVLMKYPLQLPYLFGENSFEKYKNEAQKNKLTVGINKSETLSFDIDTSEDVRTYYKIIIKDQS